MGLFSNLFGGGKDTDAAKRFVNDLLKNVQNTQSPAQQPSPPPAPSSPAASPRPVNNTPSGFSWGEDMPSEDNQFNFNGSYQQYFENIFLTDFSDYEIRLSLAPYTRMPCYTFIKNGRTALVVELFSEKSQACTIRNDCRKKLIPYLRYYIDHHGWWNTRQYVISRTKSALLF